MKMLKMRDAVTETERNQKASPSSLLPSFDNSRCFSLCFVYTTLPFQSFCSV